MSTCEFKSPSNTKKRPSVSEDANRAKRVALEDGFLSRYNDTNPILVVLAPLRRRQGQILERNLAEAGATVLSRDQYNTVDAERANLLVVTDDATKATIRLVGTPLEHCMAKHVSVKWASSVLAAQTWLSPEPYVIDGFVATNSSTQLSLFSEESTVEQSAHSLSDSDVHVKVVPVWCSGPITEQSDIAEKHQFLKKLPQFPCQRCTMTPSLYASPNAELSELLDKVAKKRRLEQAGGSEHSADIRSRAYRRASAALKCVPFKFRTSKDAEALSSFGPRVLAAASEFFRTGSLMEATLLESDYRLRTLARFQDMYGLGFVSARKIYDEARIRSVAQLRERVQKEPGEFADTLVKYLAHYDDLRRTTLTNAVAFKSLVEDIANEPGEGNLHVRFKLCGGFRRGEQTGHDIDLLYCRREELANDHTSVLAEITARLRARGLLKEVLRLSSDIEGWREIRYRDHDSSSIFPYAHDIMHGIAEYGGCKFRLDIVGVRDASEFCFATLAWSGSTAFQRDIRLWCEQQRQWSFSHHGLFERESGRRVDLTPFPKTEMDVFAAIGLTYRPPFERSC